MTGYFLFNLLQPQHKFGRNNMAAFQFRTVLLTPNYGFLNFDVASRFRKLCFRAIKSTFILGKNHTKTLLICNLPNRSCNNILSVRDVLCVCLEKLTTNPGSRLNFTLDKSCQLHATSLFLHALLKRSR